MATVTRPAAITSVTWDEQGAALSNLATLVRAARAISGNATLYGLLDTAGDATLYDRLKQEPRNSAVTCLFDGRAELEYGRQAPYLMTLHQESALTHDWLDWGWRRHWGVWLTSSASPARIKTHLKKFLFIKHPEHGRTYFRYYDPRVLPQAMSILDQTQHAQLFGLDGWVRIQSWLTLQGADGGPPTPDDAQLAGYRLSQNLLERWISASTLHQQTWPWNTSGLAP